MSEACCVDWRDRRRPIGARSDKNKFKSFRKQHNNSVNGENRKNVCGICLLSEDHILLVKQRKTGKWSLPKGAREDPETRYACMMRELFEETGVVLNDHSHTVVHNQNFFHNTIYFVHLHGGHERLTLSPQDIVEIEEAAWVKVQNIPQLSLNRIAKQVTRALRNQLTLKNFVTPLPHQGGQSGQSGQEERCSSTSSSSSSCENSE